jgi:hypothetical protein
MQDLTMTATLELGVVAMGVLILVNSVVFVVPEPLAQAQVPSDL